MKHPSGNQTSLCIQFWLLCQQIEGEVQSYSFTECQLMLISNSSRDQLQPVTGKPIIHCNISSRPII